MFFKTLLTLVAASGMALGAALLEGEVSARSGKHQAVIFSGDFCLGDTLDTETQFGCGGTCHQVKSARSILHEQDGPGNPKPTASYFSDSNCQNQIGSAGIFNGQTGGCTDVPQTFNSFFLFFDC